MEKFSYGEYVIYTPNYKNPEIGRVTKDNGGKNVFVCYHDGCTAAGTPRELLREATDEEILKASPNLGYNRFNMECKEYSPDICSCCIHDTKQKGV